MNLYASVRRNRLRVGALAVLVALVGAAMVQWNVDVAVLFSEGTFERSLQQATPIALAAIGGLYAEKSGVFNIGLEGFMIFGAVVAAVVTWIVTGGSGGDIGQGALWFGVIAAMVLVAFLTVIYGVLTIRYKADQIVTGLAVWFIALGLGPFTAFVVWDGVNSPTLASIDDVAIPLASDVPFLGPILFEGSPLMLLTVVVAVLAWAVLFRTRFGYWVQAAGENPEALDTAGVDVNRVRYTTVIFSGAMCGLAGAALAVGFSNGFTGTGVTMVNGAGWIAIVAYLFGNYNPLGAFGAAVLFGFMNMLQVQSQTLGIPLHGRIVGLFPYVAVIVVLVWVGYTRMPAAVGEPYETEGR